MSNDYVYVQSGRPSNTTTSGAGYEPWTFSWSGALFTHVGTAAFPVDVPSELRLVRFTVGVVGTGTTTFDIKRNGVSIFNTTPQLLASQQWVRISTGFRTTKFSVDDLITIDTVSVTGTAPQDLTVTMRVKTLA